MVSKEPINLRKWSPPGGSRQGARLFTCGRPGRATYGAKRIHVDNATIDKWVNGLPKADVLHIISLLGRKPDGFSEFGYYPFRSSKESGTKPTFQEWLNERYGRRFVVHEFPTEDLKPIPPQVLEDVKRCLLDLIEKGSTIVVVDSGGARRSASACKAIGYRVTSPDYSRKMLKKA